MKIYQKINIAIILVLLILIPPVNADNITQVGFVDISSCVYDGLDAFKMANIVIHPDLDAAYALGSSIGSDTSTISVIDTTTITSPSLDNCFVVGTRADIVNMKLRTTTGGTGSALLSVPNNKAADYKLRFVNVSADGLSLNIATTISFGGAADAVKDAASLDDSGITWLSVEITNNELYSQSSITGARTKQLDLSPAVNYNGISNFIGLSTQYHLISGDDGQSLVKGSSDEIYVDTNACPFDTATSYDRLDEGGDFFGLGCETKHFIYELDQAAQNISNVFQANNAASNALLEFTATNSYLVHNGTNKIIEYNVTSAGIIHLGNHLLNASNTGISSMEYKFPYLYVLDAADEAIYIYEFTPSGLAPGDNRKPRFTSVDPTTATIFLTDTEFFLVDIDNPETNTVGEQALSATACTYEEVTPEQENFPTGTFNETCQGLISVGIINGNDFTNMLNISNCTNTDLPFSQSYDQDVRASFDLYAPGSNGQLNFSWTQLNGVTIATFQATIINDTLNLSSSGNTLLSGVNMTSPSGSVPTRLFFTMGPTSTVSGFENTMYVSTNYYSKSVLADIDKTFCDTTTFCWVGNFPTSTGSVSNIGNLRILGASGNLAIDNIKLVTNNDYPEYTEPVFADLTGTPNCTYPTFGVFQTRHWVTDEIYQENFLVWEDSTITVSATGISTGSNPLNSSIAAIITDVAAIGNFNDAASLAILALIFIAVLVFGAFKVTDGNVPAGIFVGAITTILFFTLGWLPIGALAVIILIAAGLLTFLARTVFLGDA